MPGEASHHCACPQVDRVWTLEGRLPADLIDPTLAGAPICSSSDRRLLTHRADRIRTVGEFPAARHRQACPHALIRCRACQYAEEIRHRPSTDLATCHPCKRDVLRRFHCVVKPPSLKLAVPPHPVRPFERALCVIVAELGAPFNDV